MNSRDEPPTVFEPSQNASHRILIRRVELIGGDRVVEMHPGLNIVLGDITTGKTTFVRLLRALLGTVPSALPEETEYIDALRAVVDIGSREWVINRPLTTTRSAPVDLSELTDEPGYEPLFFRLPASGTQASYGNFLLRESGIPVVSVPQARSKPTEGLTPVSISDWMGYCVVTGDEIDTQVFGHSHPFRNQKRRWVFELAYGLYDPEVAMLIAKLKMVTNRINGLERESEVIEKFLADTPFASRDALAQQISHVESEIDAMSNARQLSDELPLDAGEIREKLLAVRASNSELANEIRRTEGQLRDLRDLNGQLKSQFARLTRAVISDEWLVDFDFVVCPRCGSDVDATRSDDPSKCYLCLQDPHPTPSRDAYLIEQDRILAQVHETESVISLREKTLDFLNVNLQESREKETELSAELNTRTRSFVSDQAASLEDVAARRAYLKSQYARLQEYSELLERFGDTGAAKRILEEEKADIEAEIERRELEVSPADENIQALEVRMLEYLRRLRIPSIGQGTSVSIDRDTYMPKVSGRSFDALSSQGLKTLVNIAHALAHHTVAIDRGLRLPGILILDGVSANSGEGDFDQERVRDVYRLLIAEAGKYKNSLQLIAVDNSVPWEFYEELREKFVLHLTQEDKLVRF
ncbi:hypothetical protein OG511_25590 [Streptomyces sp. NBC_01453]|uniref:hypothetical protein n=1 Tax=Streptomyces sp. NBC_01453 TaxID=2903873 RepID=UPI002E2D69A9|nr:hypothetical protein [Streptomyces sp. NBC_01453]